MKRSTKGSVIVILEKDYSDGEIDCVGVATSHENAIKVLNKYYFNYKILSSFCPEQGDSPYLVETIEVDYSSGLFKKYEIYYSWKKLDKI